MLTTEKIRIDDSDREVNKVVCIDGYIIDKPEKVEYEKETGLYYITHKKDNFSHYNGTLTTVVSKENARLQLFERDKKALDKLLKGKSIVKQLGEKPRKEEIEDEQEIQTK